jgi:hypothetical protein
MGTSYFTVFLMSYLIEHHPAKTMIVSIALAASMLFFLF